MEPAQFDFLSELVPVTKGPISPEQKLKWLAEQTRHHLMPQYERLERLEELNRKIEK